MIVSYNLVWRFYALSSETAQGHGAIIESLLKPGEAELARISKDNFDRFTFFFGTMYLLGGKI